MNDFVKCSWSNHLLLNVNSARQPSDLVVISAGRGWLHGLCLCWDKVLIWWGKYLDIHSDNLVNLKPNTVGNFSHFQTFKKKKISLGWYQISFSLNLSGRAYPGWREQ